MKEAQIYIKEAQEGRRREVWAYFKCRELPNPNSYLKIKTLLSPTGDTED